jgi:hypothetical protein
MKAKHVKLTTPVRLTRSGNRATDKRIKRKGRKYGRSDRMVLDFGDIDLEEAADGGEVQADWGTRMHLSRSWARILTRRMRHRKMQSIGMEDQKNKRRVFYSHL